MTSRGNSKGKFRDLKRQKGFIKAKRKFLKKIKEINCRESLATKLVYIPQEKRAFYSSLVGKNITEVALLCGHVWTKVVEELLNHGVKVLAKEKFKEDHLQKIFHFLESKPEPMPMIRKNKIQPSKGIPGNYRNLIYTHPKQ